MKFFPVKKLSGIETKNDGTDQDRGTLRRADSVIIAPQSGLSSGPTWATAWGLSALATSMATALAGATAGKVHLVKLSDASGNTWLIAWDLSTATCRGLWCVAGSGTAPDFAGGTPTITATNNAAYRDKTAGLFWYGAWCGDRLILGNGTDANLVWVSAGVLGLFTASATDTADPSQNTFPPCTSFMQSPDGVLYASGNVTTPARIYASDPPTQAYPVITGLLTADRSFVAVAATNARGGIVTALSPARDGAIAHLGNGGAVWVGGWNHSSDGYLLDQKPLENVSGAINPACVANASYGADYLGADFELYSAVSRTTDSFSKEVSRAKQIETWKSAGQWNRAMYRGTVAAVRPMIVDDTFNDRVWILAPLALRQLPGLYCFDRESHSVCGPFHYPSLTCIAPMLRQNLNSAAEPEGNGSPFIVLGVSETGALMFADLGKVGELALDPIGTAIGARSTAAGAQPTPTKGLCCIGVDMSSGSPTFVRVDSAGRCDLLADPWTDWASNASSVPGGITQWYNDATLGLIEIVPEDFGSPVFEKEFLEVRLQWRRNQRVYAAVFAESGQQRDAVWLDTPYPDEEQLAPICVRGTRMKLRIALVLFNGAPAMLPDLTIGYLEAGATR